MLSDGNTMKIEDKTGIHTVKKITFLRKNWRKGLCVLNRRLGRKRTPVLLLKDLGEVGKPRSKN